ncbi:hypothetical protein E3P89_03044 [Wallemia ichthyophaga]|uniref:Uncharacterized protein n=1 Tax=Wallemia ichthyophaga TaxID=245174 RepID=A0A4T0H3S0_WALIC|nr:hypothetical protein E3P93_03069 [Wallemia ichthyophaga]TIB09991.1 hypothetical protein E3P90_03065 [Wallemia ichthyophaga]TIB20758.1 hypothetical protein E3P89_03044 [Wallemia ichthyophaga]TIB22489.1 hypothetical protein E3P88_03035 [Wallemia ichthyophaga]
MGRMTSTQIRSGHFPTAKSYRFRFKLSDSPLCSNRQYHTQNPAKPPRNPHCTHARGGQHSHGSHLKNSKNRQRQSQLHQDRQAVGKCAPGHSLSSNTAPLWTLPYH